MPLELFFEPVVLILLLLIAIICVMGGYYTYLSVHKSANNNK